MELTKEQEHREGRAAQELLKNDGFARAIVLSRDKIIRQWTEAKTVEEREQLWHDWHSIARVIDGLDVVAGRGHLVQAELDRHTKPATRSA